jgi:serine O-acetyltransferase
MFVLHRAELGLLNSSVAEALRSSEACFQASLVKSFRRNGDAFFDPFHSGQYCIFLYWLSCVLGRSSYTRALATRVYLLNKALHGCDLYYEVQLPRIFSLDHPVGTVLGRAAYSDYFFFVQNCTVGNNRGRYPVFEERVSLLAGAMVLGNSHIGQNCIISARTLVKDADIPPNSLVFGESPNLVIKSRPRAYFDRYFSGIWNLDYNRNSMDPPR